MHAMLLAAALVGCSDYVLHAPDDDVPAGDDTAPTVDTGVPVDTEPVATAPVYAHTSTELFEVEPSTGARTRIGAFHTPWGEAIEGMVDIAIDLDGYMYGGSWTHLYRVDPSTAESTEVCEPTVSLTAMTFTSAGVLVVAGEDRVVRLDTTNCGFGPLVTSSPYETSGDVVGLPDGYLYWTVRGTSGDKLVRVDPNTGGAVYIGEIGVSRLFGLGYHEGQLYGFGDGGEIARIQPSNAAATVVTNAGISWWGATTNPVVWE